MATKRAATKARASAVSTSGASLDFAFFRFLWRFNPVTRPFIAGSQLK